MQRHTKAPLNATMYIGGKNRPLMIRLQGKAQDKRKGETEVDLKPDQRRSRIESQMKNSEQLNILEGLRIRRIQDLQDLKERRQVFFGFQLPTMERTPSGAPKEVEVEV